MSATRSLVAVVGGKNYGKTSLTKALGEVTTPGKRRDAVWARCRNVDLGLFFWRRTRAVNEPPPLTLSELRAMFAKVEHAAVDAGLVMAIRPRGGADHRSLEGFVREAHGRRFRVAAVVLDPGAGDQSDPRDAVEARLRLKAAGIPFVVVNPKNQAAAVRTVLRLLSREGKGRAKDRAA